MKLIFSLAVITNGNQKVEDLIKPYLRKNYDIDLKECIKKQRNYIAGVLFGNFDGYYDSKLLVLKNEKDIEDLGYKAKIKDVQWQKMVELENEELKEQGIDIEKEGVKLDERFGFTNAIITPDGKWHGMEPLNLVAVGFTKKEPCADYIKNYYTKYIKPYEKDGNITILTCNI